MMKLHRKSRVTQQENTHQEDTVSYLKNTCSDDRSRGMQILLEAQRLYNSMYRFRKDRDRNKRYVYGEQWSDLVDVDGVTMTESDYIKSQGSVPLKTNLIRRQVNTVVGLFLNQNNEPTCIARDRDEQQQAEVMSTVLQYNLQLNRMSEMYASSMEEFLISGLIVHRKWYGWMNDKLDCWTEYVQPNNFIIDCNMRDFRGWDCSFVGEIHDLSIDILMNRFAKNPDDYKRLAEIYNTATKMGRNVNTWEEFGFGRNNVDLSFLYPFDDTRCRVIEVWRKESKPRYLCHDYNSGHIFKIDKEDYKALVEDENAKRRELAIQSDIPEEEVPYIEATWFMDTYWYYYFLSPTGDILEEGETPYDHKSHPYVFKAYPFIDGEIHSFVNDTIDQQRYINRLYMLNEWIIKASAKGVLMVPEDCVRGRDPREFTENWTKFNGVIFYTPSKTGAKPEQVATNSTNIGLQELLSMQLKMMEDVSGVNSAMQGKSQYSGTSAALFNMQTQNASNSLRRILDAFSGFIEEGAYKDVKNIQQFYSQKKNISIAGKISSNIIYDPAKIRDIEFDMSIVPSQSSPVYRAISNDFLMELFRSQAISVEQLLQVGDFPFADELLQSIQVQKEQLEAGQVPDGLSPDLLNKAQQGANPKAMQMLQQAMSNQQE